MRAASSHPEPHRAALAAHYDALWTAAEPDVREGRTTLDALATRKDRDARRGLTLLARPSADVTAALTAFTDELRAIEPAQYYQPASDLHLTVLSLFTATAEWEPQIARLDDYRAAVDEALADAATFSILLEGVTLSTGAVLARGFPLDGTLERIRERLRAALVARGLGGSLDSRYRLETAHATLVRFTAPLVDPARFVRALGAARERPFGTTECVRLELVFGDWYQSADRSRLVVTWPLGAG